MKKLLSVIVILGVFFSISSQLTFAKSQPTKSPAVLNPQSIPGQTRVYRSILDNIVIVLSADSDFYGTGFFISPYGHILTNAHVVSGGKKFQLCYSSYGSDGVSNGIVCYQSDKLKLLAKDSYLDLALLQLPQIPNAYNNNYLILGNSDSLRTEDEVKVLGYPGDELVNLDVANGLITKKDPDFIFTDVPVSPGNSGSPVLNDKNEAIGIVTIKLFPEYGNGAGAISSNVVKEWLRSIKFNGRSTINNLKEEKKMATFVSREGGFSVNFSGEPKFFSEEEDEEYVGKIIQNIYVYVTNNNEILYVLYSSATKEQLNQLFSIEYIKKHSASDEVKDIYGTIIDEEIKLVQNGKDKKIYYKGKSSKGFYLISEAYASKDKFYEAGVLKKDSYADDKLVESFLKSFKLIEK